MTNNQETIPNTFEQELALWHYALRQAVRQYSELDEHYALGYLRGMERAKELLSDGAQ